jgi:hypothetical protein
MARTTISLTREHMALIQGYRRGGKAMKVAEHAAERRRQAPADRAHEEAHAEGPAALDEVKAVPQGPGLSLSPEQVGDRSGGRCSHPA